MRFNSKVIVATGVLAIFAAGIVGNAMAAPDHPRRHQVNQRLKNQNKRINREYKEGEISRQQARQLHREDHRIRREEQVMASQNGGHITKQEQRTLNQQENSVSRQIGK
jgi:hypothetical protein